ncbi:acyltransferase GLAUCE [Magnolia sinica]|uniref:acyltransferase GLAUCE n=1 Tax=Magnolia sinica TaxID=86752 RepID=UPI00265A4553|nr:acyltransferase GLAUCE [Magnolia sinica]
MGAISPELSLVHDLKVTLHRSSIITPSEKTERRSMFLSNIDQVLNFDVETIHFFRATHDFPPEKVVQKIEKALGKLLVPYDFLAGRLRFDPQAGRLEIDCNGAGVGFAVATSELSLDEIGDMVYPNPAFRQLIFAKEAILGPEDQPLMLLQVTSFKCGGFAFGITNNHTTFDGFSFKIFLENLASLASDKPLAITPYSNRHLLAARSPPTVTFSHPELSELQLPPKGEELQPTNLESGSNNVEFKVFHLSSDDIASLKEKAKSEGGSGPAITGFNVVTAHIWRCRVLAAAVDHDLERTSTVLYAVDLRSRLQPPLPRSYTGNAVLTGYGSATRRELEDGPFFQLVEAVREGATRMTDEYARSVIDWGQLHKGFPRGDVMVSSWWKLGFSDVDFPWGRPIYCCPVMIPSIDIIVLFPSVEGTDSNGVNACVALPKECMIKFENIFHKLLA